MMVAAKEIGATHMNYVAINVKFGDFGKNYSRPNSNSCLFRDLSCGHENHLAHRECSVLHEAIAKLRGENAKAYRIVEIPADVEYEIADYDGAEWIAEKHRTWYAQ